MHSHARMHARTHTLKCLHCCAVFGSELVAFGGIPGGLGAPAPMSPQRAGGLGPGQIGGAWGLVRQEEPGAWLDRRSLGPGQIGGAWGLVR